MATVLFVLSGARHWTLADGTEHPTGYWAEELAAPHRAFTAASHEVVIATPGGAVPAADPASLTADANGGPDGAAAVTATLDAIPGLRAPRRLEDVDAADYDAVFYPGGHGPMQDLATDSASGRLLTAALESGRPLAALCHGPAALLAARRPDGSSPFAGYRLTAFTNAEETLAGYADRAPWLLQDRLTALGADFVHAEPWASHVVADRNLYTGQNPASSEALATEVIKALG